MIIRIRNSLALLLLVATAETRLTVRALPGVIRAVAPIVAWAALAIGMGVVIGFAAVALPPLGAFGLVVPFGLVLLWAMPDLPLVYPGFIRKALLFSLVIELCVPDYYTVQLGDLPWISVRRVAAAFLIVPVLLALACSSDVRRRVVERARSSVLIIICAVGFLVMAFLSIPTSPVPMTSLSAIIDAILGWYIPFVAILYVLKDKDDAIFMLKVICFCAIIVTIIGLGGI